MISATFRVTSTRRTSFQGRYLDQVIFRVPQQGNYQYSFSVPSVWDLSSDYNFAYNLNEVGFYTLSYLSYLFITFPWIVYTVSELQRLLDRCCYSCSSSWLGRVVAYSVTIIMVGLVISGMVLGLLFAYEDILILVMKILAITVGCMGLGVNMLRAFVHTEKVRIICVRARAYEGIYESALQLFLIFYVWLAGLDGLQLDVSAMASSLLMIGKSSALNFLTLGQENKMEDRNSLAKLKIIGKFLPVFLLRASFRVIGLAACLAWDIEVFLYILLPAVLVLPLLVLLLVKLCGHLGNLSVIDLVKGCVGEMSSIVLWGETGR